ncbi:MAG: DbpA RNA binding domain-containing protein, partial [Bacteroidales bacterium]|nr:DbpA RNA binding domain-containing protein [Bacteroidales bacterium]
LSKKDVAGFLFQKGGLAKDEPGIIEIKESCSYAAIKRSKLPELLQRIRDEKIKNMKARFE